MSQEFLTELLTSDVVINAVAVAVISLIGMIIKFVSTKTKSIKAQESLFVFRTVLEETVLSIQEVVVKELLKAKGDGILSDDEKDIIKSKAVMLIKDQLGESTKKTLARIHGDLDIVIDNFIEAQVFKNKANKK